MQRKCQIVAAASVAWLCAWTSANAEPVPRGAAQMTFQLSRADLTVYTYRPDCRAPSLLIVLHGMNRNAEDYMKHARPLAEQHCLLIAAPLFDKERFPSWRYQLGGIAHRHAIADPSQWTGSLVMELVEHIRGLEGRNMPYSLIGHSAGGQFLSRIAAFIPTDAQRIVIANPSTHVWPDLTVQAPFGMGGVYPEATGEAALRRYLELPITIYLGDEDTGDKNLNQTPEGMSQGATRRERGLNVFAVAQKLAQANAWTFNWRLVKAEGIGHNAGRMLSSPSAWQALRPGNGNAKHVGVKRTPQLVTTPTPPNAESPMRPPPSYDRPLPQPVEVDQENPICAEGSWAMERDEMKYVCLSWFLRGSTYTPAELEQVLAQLKKSSPRQPSPSRSAPPPVGERPPAATHSESPDKWCKAEFPSFSVSIQFPCKIVSESLPTAFR
jgi:pimeloyl-ACP methyl ester carboxylesterase